MTACSYRDKGQMFGTDGHITWTEPALFEMIDQLEAVVTEIVTSESVEVSPEYHDESQQSWLYFADEGER